MTAADPLAWQDTFEPPTTAHEIVSMIMSMHWDIGACLCWVCEAGRVAGVRNRSDYIHHWKREGFDMVEVPDFGRWSDAP